MTPLLQVENLTKSFGDLILFRDITFSISEGQRVGLIAKNGNGKTTLLKMLSREEGCDSGKITFRKYVNMAYLPQYPAYGEDMTVLEACFKNSTRMAALIRRYEECLETEGNPGLDGILNEMDAQKAWEYERNIKEILTRLNITNHNQSIRELSGGQIKRIALANALINKPEFLILDEPTNHLDIEMTEWLENYLKDSKLTLLMVTHDRYLINSVCTDIYEIDGKTMYQYKGGYDYYLEKRQERIDAETAEIEKARNLYRKELEWMRRMPQARGHKARYREEAFYELEKTAKKTMSEAELKLKDNSTYIGSKIFEAENLCKSFGRLKILDRFSYTFSRYEKLGIVGKNGTGKSTFIKILTGKEQADSGRLDIGETVRFGYYSQEGMAFDDKMKVIDAVTNIAETIDTGNGRHMTASQFLQYFLFAPSRQHDYIYKLSGGERRRLYLCTVLMRNPNFLILDEPTNDLDIMTLRVLENYLQSFKGCLIVVSHDRYFMDKIVDHLFVFQGNGVIKDFPGNYTDYRLKCQEDEKDRKKEEKAQAKNKNTKIKTETKRKLTFAERREYESLEKEISDLETEKASLENDLCSGTLPVEELTAKSKRLVTVGGEIEAKTLRWLKLAEIDEA